MVVVSMMETSVASVATGEEDAVVTSAAAAAHAAAAAAAHISAAGPRDANSASNNIPLGIESSSVATSPRSSWPYETSTVNLHLPPPPASPRCDFSVR